MIFDGLDEWAAIEATLNPPPHEAWLWAYIEAAERKHLDIPDELREDVIQIRHSYRAAGYFKGTTKVGRLLSVLYDGVYYPPPGPPRHRERKP